jgi:hypothetical protein
MSEHWWHDDDPKAVEARQIIFGLQSELAQAKEELTRLRAQVNRTSLGHAQHPSRFRFIPEELTWRKHEANARRMGGLPRHHYIVTGKPRCPICCRRSNRLDWRCAPRTRKRWRLKPLAMGQWRTVDLRQLELGRAKQFWRA